MLCFVEKDRKTNVKPVRNFAIDVTICESVP